MSNVDPAQQEYRRLRRQVLDLYDVVTFLMLIGIAILVVYSILLGPLTSPGAEESFGLAIALMFLMATLIVHLIDRTYRVWPLGRKVTPTPPGPVTVQSQARFLKVLIFVIALAAIAYVIGGLLT
ncbi:MAG: hypothetical protein WA691_09485 [Thermoplasmata archaeon]